MLRPRSFLVVASILALASQGFAQTTVQGEPFGYVKISIPAGSGTTKKTSLISIPLLQEASITGNAAGRITGVTSNTISAAGAGWMEGELSTAATPHFIEITSGEAKGRILLISTSVANTPDTVTISSEERELVGDLTSLGIVAGAEAGNTYLIRRADTITSVFGTPERTGIQGGASASSADTLVIIDRGSSSTYFYKTDVTPPRWSRVGLGSPDASNVPIPPYAGIQYARIADTPIELIVTGRVPSGDREVSIKMSGVTLLASYWPVNQTLGELRIENIPNWVKSTASGVADKILLSSGGSPSTYFHDGLNWRRVGLGSPVADSTVVPIGSSIMVNKRGSEGGFVFYEHGAPYDVQQ